MPAGAEQVSVLCDSIQDDGLTFPDLRTALAKLIALSYNPDLRDAAAPAIRAAEQRLQKALTCC